MSSIKYRYDLVQDFPNGQVYLPNLIDEIQASAITIALDHVDLKSKNVDIWFKTTLPSGDKEILDGNTAGPAGGLISAHDYLTKTYAPEIVQIADSPTVIPSKPVQDASNRRAYIFSIDFCKQETWYIDSVFVSEVIGSGDGTTSKFNLSHGSGLGEAIVDLYHFKVTDEAKIAPPNGSIGDYIPVVKIDGVIRTLREAYESTGGDCEIDHKEGSVTFFSPPASGEIIVDYYYVPSNVGPQIHGAPPSGSRWIIDAAETQFSSDVDICDTIVQNVFTYHPIYGWIRVPEDQGGVADAEYGHLGNYLDYSHGSFPIVPPVGGPTRGTTKDTVIMRWDYEVAIGLIPGLQMRVWTKHGRGFKGERATLTLYAKQEPYP